MIDYIRKTLNLVALLPYSFYFHFLAYLMVAILVVIFEILGVSFLMPLLSMMSNKDFDPSQFSNFVNKFNDIFVEIFSIDLILNISSLGFTIFTIYLIKIIIQFFSVWISSKIAMNAQHFYSLKLYKTYLTKNYDFHLKNGPAKLFRNVIFEVNSFASSILFQSLTMLIELLVIIAIFIFAFLVEPRITFVIIVMFLLVGILLFLTKKIIKAQGKIRIKYDERRISDVQNSFESIKDVIIYNISKLFINSFGFKNNIINISNFYVRIFATFPRLMLELTAVLVLIISIFVFQKTDGGLEIIGLFLIVAFRSMPGIAKLASTFQTFVFLKPTLDILNNEFSKISKNKKTNTLQNQKNFLFKNNIKFSKVSFFYNSKNQLISNLSFEIKKGMKIGVVGESGYGKSTMINLMMGLLKPNKGNIIIDGVKLNKNNILSWRNKVGYVGQKIAMINGGIKENIILDKAYNHKRFVKIIKGCNLETFLNKRVSDKNLKDNLSIKISGGEAQRLAIARALYQEPELLIMDESTNAVDKNMEEKILKYIFSKKSLTIIFIAHNLKSLFKCEKIINFYSKGNAKVQKKYLSKNN